MGVLDKRKTILKLLADHDLEPRETLFVADMQHDLEAAHHGGVQSCAVLTGYNTPKQIRESAPDYLYRDLSGVLKMLKKQSAKKATDRNLSKRADG